MPDLVATYMPDLVAAEPNFAVDAHRSGELCIRVYLLSESSFVSESTESNFAVDAHRSCSSFRGRSFASESIFTVTRLVDRTIINHGHLTPSAGPVCRLLRVSHPSSDRLVSRHAMDIPLPGLPRRSRGYSSSGCQLNKITVA